MSSPFETGCVVTSNGGYNGGITFKLSPRTEFCSSYGQFQWAWLTEDSVLSVAFSHHVVVVEGYGLQPLVELIAQQQLMVVSVAPRSTKLFAEQKGSSTPIVFSIRVEDRNRKGDPNG